MAAATTKATASASAAKAADETTGLLRLHDGGANDEQQKTKSGCCFGVTYLMIGVLIGSLLTITTMFMVGRQFIVVPVIPPQSIMPPTSSSASSSSSSSSSRKYRATQFISFSINTMGGVAEYGECNDPTLVDPDDGLCYLGNSQNLTEDVKHRYMILQSVFETMKQDALSSEVSKIDHSSDVLKIFMIPEFYWRGPNGAYSIADMAEGGALVQLSDAFIDVLDSEHFEHWLFVFGTVIIAESPRDPSKPWEFDSRHIDKDDVLYYNVAPVVRGGPDIINHRYIIDKNYISTADFLSRSKGLPNPRESDVLRYSSLMDVQNGNLVDFWAKRGSHFVDGNILEIDGIRIGLEICLDHARSVLWDQLLDEKNGTTSTKVFDRDGEDGHVSVEEDDLVDVHLVVSAGMTLERGPTPIKRGGVAYLTDGEASSAACQRPRDDTEYDPERVCRATHDNGPDGLKHIHNIEETKATTTTTTTTQSYSPYIELSSCINPDDAPWKPLMEGYFSNHATQGCAFTLKMHGMDVYDEMSFYPPSIEIYPTIDLP